MRYSRNNCYLLLPERRPDKHITDHIPHAVEEASSKPRTSLSKNSVTSMAPTYVKKSNSWLVSRISRCRTVKLRLSAFSQLLPCSRNRREPPRNRPPIVYPLCWACRISTSKRGLMIWIGSPKIPIFFLSPSTAKATSSPSRLNIGAPLHPLNSS